MREKKNEFVFTIGFKKKDPEHVRVAKMLNEMDPKNQFIVNAVLCYVDSGYVNVRPWNLQPLFVQAENIQPSVQIKQGPKPLKEDEELDENDARTIMQSLKNFRAWYYYEHCFIIHYHENKFLLPNKSNKYIWGFTMETVSWNVQLCVYNIQ